MKTVVSTMTLLVLMSFMHPCNAETAKGWRATGSTRIVMATLLGASDGYDSQDYIAYEHSGWMAGCYHSADEWGSSAGFYANDLRAPLTLGETKTWMLYIWGVPESATSDFNVYWSGSSASLVQGKLELVQKPAGITGGPALGTVWTTPPASLTLPLYTTTDGLTGYGFKFTLTAVPEPSSILALAGGIAGLGGLTLRRRRA